MMKGCQWKGHYTTADTVCSDRVSWDVHFFVQQSNILGDTGKQRNYFAAAGKRQGAGWTEGHHQTQQRQQHCRRDTQQNA